MIIPESLCSATGTIDAGSRLVFFGTERLVAAGISPASARYLLSKTYQYCYTVISVIVFDRGAESVYNPGVADYAKRVRILVVDEPPVRKTIRVLLERHGYEVVEASAREAVNIARDRARDIKLLITHDSECARLAPRDIPVLCLSGGPTEQMLTACSSLGCRIVSKPFRMTDLLDAVRNLTGESREEPEDGHLSDDQLEGYSLRLLDAEVEQSVREHLLACEKCRAAVAVAEQFIDVLRAAGARIKGPPKP